MASGSTTVVLIALGCNLGIAAAKFMAAAYTGSSAMLSEAIHSLIDCSNQALLLHGQRRAARPADAAHPFGHGRELFFWGFVVALLLFSLGAGVAIYEGIDKVLHPHPVTSAWVNYTVLGFAIVLEAISTFAALRALKESRAKGGVWQALRASKDPALFIILVEDCAALTGLTIAIVGIAAADIGGYPEADGIASIAIGLVLAFVAAFVAIEVKSLLIGEAAAPELQAGIERLIQDEAATGGQIRALHEVRTMQLGSNDVLVTASIDFDDTARAADVEATNDRLEAAIQTAFPSVRHMFIKVSQSTVVVPAVVVPVVAGRRSDAASEPISAAARPTVATSQPPPVKKHKAKKSRR